MKYCIGSFNLKKFGDENKKDLEVIAAIINEEDFDVIALQEVFTKGYGVESLVSQYLSSEKWDMCSNTPQDTVYQFKDFEEKCNDEGFAFIWKKSKFKLPKYYCCTKFKPRIINKMADDRDITESCDVFKRMTPYYIRLIPQNGGFFELRLLNIHLYWGNEGLGAIAQRNKEYEFLIKTLYPEISSKRYGDYRPAYTYALGDYNLSIPNISDKTKGYVSNEKRGAAKGLKQKDDEEYDLRDDYQYNPPEIDYSYMIGDKAVDIYTRQYDKTTLSGSKDGYISNYDHVTYSPQINVHEPINCNRVDVVERYCQKYQEEKWKYYYDNISDHAPIKIIIDL